MNTKLFTKYCSIKAQKELRSDKMLTLNQKTERLLRRQETRFKKLSMKIKKMTHLGIKWHLINVIGDMLFKSTFSIGDKKILTTNGVIQGSWLGPILFLIYINDLLNELEQPYFEPLCFEDDLIILVKEIEWVKEAVWRTSKWAEENSMRINPEKSGILRILGWQSNRAPEDVKYHLSNCLQIPQVSSYKYLGISFNESLSFTNQRKLIKAK